MTTTTGSSANFRAPSGTNEALNNTFQAFAREATELVKALIQPASSLKKWCRRVRCRSRNSPLKTEATTRHRHRCV